MFRDTDRTSYWIDDAPGGARAPLAEDVEAEVAVVGAGIVGLTAAHLLARAGKSVVVLDRLDLARADTGHTTAHLSYVVDTPLPDLVKLHGVEASKKAWDASRFAVDLIERIQRDEDIACDFARLPGVLYGPRPHDGDYLEHYARLAESIGHAAERVEPSEVPFQAQAALRFPDNGRFHPRKYCLGLADRMERRGARLFGQTEVREVDPEGGEGDLPVVVRAASGRTVRARHVLVATHVPIVDRIRVFTRAYPMRSYVVAGRVPKGSVGDALYWDTLSPFHYARLQPEADHDVLMFGGEDHKAGHVEETQERWDKLERTLHETSSVQMEVQWRWSAQDPGTLDHLPYIGVNPGGHENELIATGFGGNGMTYGTLAGWMLAERVLGNQTPYDALFDPERLSLGQLRRWAKENKDYPMHLVKDYAKDRRGPAVDDLRPGQGAVLTSGLRKIAVAKDDEGRLHAVSAVCRHMGCLVHWNQGERSWDCPCHGSRYAIDGQVLEGPAKTPLDPVAPEDLPQEARARQER